MKKMISRLEGINGIFLILYLWIVLGAYFYISFPTIPLGMFWGGFAAILVVLMLACPPILRFLRRIKLKPSNTLRTRKQKVAWFSAFWGVSIVILMVYYLAYYPGSFPCDSINQYGQAVTGQYNDWHPALHTLLFFTLPLKLTGGRIGAMVLFQVGCFSLALAYLAYVLLKYSNRMFSIFALLLILVPSLTGVMAMFPWKDSAFAIVALLSMVFALEIYFTNGQWMNRPGRWLMLSSVLTLGTILRHNGMLFTMPLFLAILFQLKPKRSVLLVVSFSIMLFVVKGPLYSLLDVRQPGSRQTEVLGLPLTVIGNAVKESPEELSDEVLEFAYDLATQEQWETLYVTGDFNSIKRTGIIDANVIEEAGAMKVLSMMFQCFQDAPKPSFTALICLTDAVYSLTDGAGWKLEFTCTPNDYGIISPTGFSGLRAVLSDYQTINDCLGTYLSLGTIMLIVLACALAKLNAKKDWKKLLFVLPMFISNFGTMLLLTGPDFRFFYYSILIAPALLLLLFRESGKESVYEYRKEE